MTIARRRSAVEPDRRSWFEFHQVSFCLDPHPQGIAIVIADRTLSLPCRELSERQ